MALKPPRPCKQPGCHNLTRDGWCPEHKPQKARRKDSEAWHRLYNTSLWTKELRPAQLLREPWCRECARLDPPRRTKATVVDHVVPHEGDLALFSDPGNLQSLCKRHHDAKTMREMHEKRAKK